MAKNTIKSCIDALFDDTAKTASERINALLAMRRDMRGATVSGDGGALPSNGDLIEDLRRIDAALQSLGVNPASIDQDSSDGL